MPKITIADIKFNENGIPVSDFYDDIYFSQENGLEESHYVFQQGNRLAERWPLHQNAQFVVAETGFGTGLNFLALCAAFDEFKQVNNKATLKKLHFISFEKFPLSREQLIQALSQWPSLSRYANALIENYPSLIAGPHRLHITNDISMDLYLGDVADNLPQIHNRETGIVDAWFLDGFAPSKNPDMWQDALFEQMARLAKDKATFSTFTAAGFVRRGLIAAGFEVKKQAGFGRKREMICGVLNTREDINTTIKADKKIQQLSLLHPFKAHKTKTPNKNEIKKVSIIGGGISAICCANALSQRGYQVSIYCQAELADAASGNRQGAIYPLLQLKHNNLSEFYAKAFEYAMRFYHQQKNNFDFAFDDCGVLQMAFNDDRKKRLQQQVDSELWPETLVEAITSEQADALANIKIDCPAWFFPKAGWLNPPSFTHGLSKYLQEHANLKVFSHHKVSDLSYQEDQQLWQFTTEQHGKTKQQQSELVVLCTGHQVNDLMTKEFMPVQAVRGQVSHLKTNEHLSNLNTVICHKGYLTPQWQNLHCAGASFLKDDDNIDYRASEDDSNIQQQNDFLSDDELTFSSDMLDSARAGIRAKTLDHLALLGNAFDNEVLTQQFKDYWKGRAVKETTEVKQGLYIMSGLGSRGLCSAPLLAEILAATINNEALPLNMPALTALQPNRFLLKKLKRRE